MIKITYLDIDKRSDDENHSTNFFFNMKHNFFLKNMLLSVMHDYMNYCLWACAWKREKRESILVHVVRGKVVPKEGHSRL